MSIAARSSTAALLVLLAAAPAAGQAPARCDQCGTVGQIRQTIEKNTWTPLGSVVPTTVPGDPGDGAGRVTSAYRVGAGGSTQGMVILGAAGGGGYAKRPNSYEQPRWDVEVRMDAGGTRTVPLRYDPPFRTGDRVRVFGTQLELVSP